MTRLFRRVYNAVPAPARLALLILTFPWGKRRR